MILPSLFLRCATVPCPLLRCFFLAIVYSFVLSASTSAFSFLQVAFEPVGLVTAPYRPQMLYLGRPCRERVLGLFVSAQMDQDLFRAELQQDLPLNVEPLPGYRSGGAVPAMRPGEPARPLARVLGKNRSATLVASGTSRSTSVSP